MALEITTQNTGSQGAYEPKTFLNYITEALTKMEI